MKVFDPLSTYSSPLRTAVVFMRATSEPASGSESPNEQRIGASISGGSHSAFCSSVPAMITGPAPRPFAPSEVPMPEQPQLSSSPTSMPSKALRPSPPYSTGTCRFIRPSCVRLRDHLDRVAHGDVVLGCDRPDLLGRELAREGAQLLLLVGEGEGDAGRDR